MLGGPDPLELESYLHPTPASSNWIYNTAALSCSCSLFSNFLLGDPKPGLKQAKRNERAAFLLSLR